LLDLVIKAKRENDFERLQQVDDRDLPAVLDIQLPLEAVTGAALLLCPLHCRAARAAGR
jgi:hypothetical protein